MDILLEILSNIWESLLKPEVAGAVMAVAAVLTIVGAFLGWWFGLWGNRGKGNGNSELKELVEIIRERDSKRIAKLEEQLETALAENHSEDRAELEGQIAELRSRLANPEKALAEEQTTSKSLEDALEREGNDIGGDRLAKAKAALKAGDFSLADDLFAEIEAREALAVQSAARAAFARGKIAKQEVRWHDASTHYQKAARLDPCYKTLLKAEFFAHRSGDYNVALTLGKASVSAAANEFGDNSNEYAAALNNHAESLRVTGEVDKAEPLYRQAGEITRETLGEEHQQYAGCLNNLAGLLRTKGDLDGAEPLYRQAIEITRKSLGEEHPQYAIFLNNLAGLLQAKGQLAEAEPLLLQAIAVAEKALGSEHPNTITFKTNHAALWAE